MATFSPQNIQRKLISLLPYRMQGNRRRYGRHTFSQGGEDVIMWNYFQSQNISRPSYADIGAHDPMYLSNTALFYKKGSRGVNIEPDPKLFAQFIKARPKDTNLNLGIARQAGTLTFYRMSTPALNTFSPKEAKKYQALGYEILEEKKIKVTTLEKALRSHFGRTSPDILSIDVEGMDYEIVKSINFKKLKPTMICCETLSFSDDNTGQKDERITRLLVRSGYQVYADTRVNTIYVRTNQ